MIDTLLFHLEVRPGRKAQAAIAAGEKGAVLTGAIEIIRLNQFQHFFFVCHRSVLSNPPITSRVILKSWENP